MPYRQEKLKALLDSIAKEPATLDMTQWVVLPDGRKGTIDLLHNGKTYTPPECGTTMCLGGHMSNAYFAEETAKGNKLSDEMLKCRYTPDAALRYVGLNRGDEDYSQYFSQFTKVFSRVKIRTVRGLRRALRQEGLL